MGSRGMIMDAPEMSCASGVEIGRDSPSANRHAKRNVEDWRVQRILTISLETSSAVQRGPHLWVYMSLRGKLASKTDVETRCNGKQGDY